MKKTDQQLIIESLSKSKDANTAFEEIVDRYKNYVFQICLSKLHNVEDAEDAAQESFVRVYFGLENFRFDSEFKTWLTQVTLNVTLTMLLSNKRKFWKNFVSEDGDVDIDAIYRSTFTKVEEQNFWNSVGTILYKMLHGYRKVFIFKYFKNLNLEKISKKIGATIGATKMKLKRAKNQFIKLLLDQ